MGRRTITTLAAIAIALAVLQQTGLAFLSPDATDFVEGLAVGLSIGAVVSWLTGRTT